MYSDAVFDLQADIDAVFHDINAVLHHVGAVFHHIDAVFHDNNAVFYVQADEYEDDQRRLRQTTTPAPCDWAGPAPKSRVNTLIQQ